MIVQGHFTGYYRDQRTLARDLEGSTEKLDENGQEVLLFGCDKLYM